jgi:hypothetical protein
MAALQEALHALAIEGLAGEHGEVVYLRHQLFRLGCAALLVECHQVANHGVGGIDQQRPFADLALLPVAEKTRHFLPTAALFARQHHGRHRLVLQAFHPDGHLLPGQLVQEQRPNLFVATPAIVTADQLAGGILSEQIFRHLGIDPGKAYTLLFEFEKLQKMGIDRRIEDDRLDGPKSTHTECARPKPQLQRA